MIEFSNHKTEQLNGQLTIASKIIKELGINLTKVAKDTYTKNYDIEKKLKTTQIIILLRGLYYPSEVSQSCPTLCDPVDCSLPGSSIHGIFQARVLEWVAISFSNSNLQIQCNPYKIFNGIFSQK